MKKKKPTASQVELLMSDWLANLREQGSFVHKNSKGAIVRKRTDNYSDYFTAGMDITDTLDVLRNAREIAQGTVASMTEVPVRVVLGKDASFTDGEVIVVATDYFDSKDLTVGDKIDILTGYSVHEAAHINHTDMKDLNDFINSFPAAEREVAKTIHNIIEDERIEFLTGEDRPGLMDFIATIKEHCWGKYEKEMSVNSEVTETLPRFINTFLCAVRFPSILTEEMVTENFDELSQIRKVLMPFPLSNEGAKAATRKIMDIMKQLIKKDLEEQKEKEQQQQQQQQNQSQPQDASQQGQGDPGQGQGQPQNPSGGRQSKSSKPTAQEVKDALRQALQSGQMQEVLKAIGQAVPEPQQKNHKNAECIERGSEGDRQFVNGNADKVPGGAGTGHLRYMIKAKPDQRQYVSAYDKVKQYIPAIKKALTCQTQSRDYELRGEKSGKLNTTKLVSLKSGNRNIFTKQGEVTCDKASVCILIDESGSMNGNRIDAARETAILIREAVKSIDNLDLFIYGFEGNNMHVYQEGEKCVKYALGSLDAGGGTPTGEAMNVAYQKMMKHSYAATLMLVITDGSPDHSHTVIEADAKLRKKGIIPIGVGIAGCTAVKRIFKEHIIINDLAELAPQLGKITKKRLMKMLERHDSLG